jgi:hypothetical protein
LPVSVTIGGHDHNVSVYGPRDRNHPEDASVSFDRGIYVIVNGAGGSRTTFTGANDIAGPGTTTVYGRVEVSNGVALPGQLNIVTLNERFGGGNGCGIVWMIAQKSSGLKKR